MYERLTKCPLCQSGHFNNAMVVKDYSVSQESFTICKCKKCEFLFTNPRPNKANIGRYYESEDYISHQDKASNLTNILYKMVRNFTLGQKVQYINKHVPKKGRLLDFGCGTGHFLKRAEEDGWETVGFEPSKVAANIAKTKNKLTIYNELVDLEGEKKFDAISLFHVLEHIHDLNSTMETLSSKLKKRGVFFIAVPNIDSFDAKEYKEGWAAWDVPRHLYHFSQETMDKFAETHDLRIKTIMPMKFDGYYVSLLSESNIHQKKNLIKSFLNGFKSNLYGKRNKNNYSSLLYILKKK
jgi:2-polyprenyl-3-methyl-5-hydroxy-6-metoxy-1,4-benzoquinol methylase